MDRWIAGPVAALIAETVFTAMVMLVRAVRGSDPWKVVKVTAAFVTGPEAVRPSGFVRPAASSHQMCCWAPSLTPRSPCRSGSPSWRSFHGRASPLTGGLVTAAILYMFGFWLLPQLFAERLAPLRLPPIGRALQLLAHAVYGLVLGAAYARLTRMNVVDGRLGA